MKKMTVSLSLVVAVALVFGCAIAQTYTFDGVFSVEYPDSWYCVDDYEDECTSTHLSVVTLNGEGDTDLNVDIEMNFYASYEGTTLYQLPDDEMQDYTDVLLSDFEDDGAVYVETITTDADGLSFVIIRGRDSQGDYYYAESMANGWAIGMWGYAFADANYNLCRDLTDEDYAQFLAIVRSFTAVRG